MKVDTIQVTESDQVFRLTLNNDREIIFKIISKSSSEWYPKHSESNENSKILTCFDGGNWIELARRNNCTSTDTMIQLACSLIPSISKSLHR